MSKLENYYNNQAIQQQEFEKAMLIENTAICDYKADVEQEYRMQQREDDAEALKEYNDTHYSWN